MYSQLDDSVLTCILCAPLAMFCTHAIIIMSVAASSGLDGYIKLWELDNGKLLKSIDGGPGITSLLPLSLRPH